MHFNIVIYATRSFCDADGEKRVLNSSFAKILFQISNHTL